MNLVTELFILVNSFFGKPKVLEAHNRDRVLSIFKDDTKPFLKEVEQYINKNSTVLIIGCNDGVEIDLIANKAYSVMACDTNQRCIELALAHTEHLENVNCCLVSDASIPFPDESFDVIFMHNVCEHLICPENAFSHYYRVLKKGGVMLNKFAPLFYSPFGAHLTDALKIPWGHLIFGFHATLSVRNKYYPEISIANSWAELGLNQITEGKYRKIISSLDVTDLRYEYSNSKGLPVVDMIPYIRNLFIFGITHVFKKN